MRAAAVAAHTFPSVSARISRILLVVLVVMSASLASLAQIAASPTSVTFSTKQAQGSTSGGQIVNITNSGPNPQAVSIAASEEFSETDNCGGSVPGNGSCGMSVFFTPAMIGAVSGAVTISDNSGNLLASVGLKGTGELQLLAVPASINFGTVQIGSTSGTPKSVKITNQDTSALTITSIASSSDYNVNTSGCLNVTLNPTKYCTITVQAAPTSENANGSIVISDSLGGTPLVIPLTVTPQGGSTVPISLSPQTLTFSEGVGGTSAAQTVTVTNTSSGAVTMNSITASSQFSETNNCPSPGMTLAAGTSCTVNVSFNPQFVGKITGSLAVLYNGTLSPQLASLTGTAVAGLTGPTSVAFSATNEGATSVAKPVIIKNNTSNTVTLGSIVLTGDFEVQAKSTTCALSGQNLAAGASCTVEVQFAPTVVGAIAGTFTVNNSLNPLVIPLSGTGNQSPFATLSPNSAEQGTVALTVNIAGQDTNFDSTTTVSFGSGITVVPSSLTINGPTSASVQITISSTATVGSRTVTISTPDMSETANATFTVLTGVPSATLNPNSGQQGTGPTTIAITGFDTTFTAASKVNFGAAGITSGTVKFNSATSLSVPITIAGNAALGARNVTITTGTKVVNATFTVTSSGPSYTIGGTISGYTGSGLMLQDNGDNTLTVSSGATTFTFSQSIPSGGTYSVTVFAQPSNPTQTCTVTNGSGTATQNVTNIQVACTTNTYTIGGSISGYTGSGLVLQDNGGSNLSVSSGATSFTFGTPIASGSTYNVTVLTQPSSPAQTCTVTNGSGTVTNSNISGVQVTCTAVTYTIGGSISGYAGSGMVLQDNGGNNLTVNSGATAFTFSQGIVSGGAYAVTVLTQPSTPTQTCTVTNGSGTVGTSNITNVQIACTTNNYTIGGTISGYAGSGLVLQDNGGNNLSVNSGATAFTFSTAIASGSAYAVTVLTQPSSPAETCTVTNGSGTVGGGNVTNVQIACAAVTYTIGGTISGYSGSGMVLQDNGGNNLTVSSGATTFTFSQAIPSGSGYNVTVLTQPSNPAQTCTVTNGSGTATSNVTSVQIACTTVTYTIGGTISGYSGSGMVLQDNGGNNLTVNSGATAFTFSQAINAGSTYNVTVLTQPTNPTETCSVTNGSGTANSNVTNVQIVCSTMTYTIGGTISGYTGSGLVLQDNGGNNLTVNSGATAFTFSQAIPSGSTYAVTVLTQPTSPAQTCTVTNGSGTATANVTNVQVACTTITYTIGGTISGYSGSGLVLLDNGGNNLSVNSGATTFTFSQALNAGSTYNVTVLTQPTSPNENCTVSNGSGTANSNVTNVAVACTVVTSSATLTPSSGHLGSTQTVVITGTATNFGPTTTVNFGANISTGTLTVNGPTSASVPITIANNAAIGSRQVIVTTGSQAVTTNFTVLAGVAAITAISPNAIAPTQSESVTVTGAFTSWVSGTTKASFGPGISVGGAAAGTFGPVTVNSGTSLTASLSTSGAFTQANPVQIQTGSQTLTVNNGIYIQTCNGTTPTVVSISPNSGALAVPLNSTIQVQFSAPMNASTFTLGSTGTVFFYDTISGLEVPGTIALDPSSTIATITPSVALPAGRTFNINLSNVGSIQDTCADLFPSQQFSFTTAFGDQLTGPTLTGTSPVNTDSNIPINAPVVLQFNDQLDPVTAQTGFSMTRSGSAVSGSFTYSPDDKTVTFTPATTLVPSATYTVAYSAAITDTVGNVLTNPGSFSFTTGTGSDTIPPSVSGVDPANQSSGAGLNVKPHVIFATPINGLTIPNALTLTYQEGGAIVPATVSVAANRLSATITPTSALLANTGYQVNLCGYTDIAGNAGVCFTSTFVTGSSAITSHPVVNSISPPNGQTSVPLNPLVIAVMSNAIDPTTVTNNSITLTPANKSAIAGTVSLASDGVTLTYTLPGTTVSTDGQSLSTQLAELKAAKCEKVFQEKVSGARSDRKQLAKLMAVLTKGDVLVVTRLDRLARSTRDLLNLLGTTAEKGAGFKFSEILGLTRRLRTAA